MGNKVEKLNDVMELGFEIVEYIYEVVEINNVYLNEDMTFGQFKDYEYSSNSAEILNEDEKIKYSIQKNNKNIIEDLSAKEVEQFFKSENYKNYL